MTRLELLDLATAFVSVKELMGVKFAYAISKNSKNLSEEVEACESSMKRSKSFIEYDEKRVVLCKEHCDKDEGGKPVIIENAGTGTYAGLKGNNSFDKAIEVLQSEYSEAIEEQKKMADEFKKFLEEEVEVELYKVKLADVPEDISVGQLNGIMAIIEE